MMKKIIFLFIVFTSIYACKDSFKPEVDAQYKNALVVDGFINIGGETRIRLSRSGDLQDSQPSIPEKNASIIIEGDKGTRLDAVTGEDGNCLIMTQSLNLNEQYKLKITTTNGKVYQTDFLENKKSPEIDSVNFNVENFGFKIYVNTHDDTKNTKYYKWEYSETWEINSFFKSIHEFKEGKVVPRDPNINLERCWSSNQSSDIILGNTERFSEDRITMMPITFVKGNSPKVWAMYSVLVKQYGLTHQAYEYLNDMKKNTEQIGGIFDAQPSVLKGNIVCISNPGEEVIGWVSAGTVSNKRVFITYKDKPKGGTGNNWSYSQPCESFIAPPDSLVYQILNRKFIIQEIQWFINGVRFTEYQMTSEDCMDCRLRGSNIKPDFWPN